MAGKPVRISILADSKEFETAMDRSSDAAGDFGRDLDKTGAKVDKMTGKFDGVGEGADTVASKGAQAAGALSGLGDTIGGPFGRAMQGAGLAMQTAADSGDLLNAAIEGGGKLAAKAGQALSGFARVTGISTLATKVQAGAQAALNAVMDANPIFLVVAAVAALVGGFVIAYNKSETFRAIVQAAFDAVKTAAKTVADFFTKDIPKAFEKVVTAVHNVWDRVRPFLAKWGTVALAVLAPFIGIPLLIFQHFDKIRGWLGGIWDKVTDTITGLPGRITGIGSKMLDAGKTLLGKLFEGIKHAAGAALNFGGDIAKDVVNGIITAIDTALNLPWKIPRISLGFGVHVGGQTLIPAIPHLAGGGITTGPTIAMIGDNPGGREAVIPLDKYDIGGNHYTINLNGTFIGATKAEIGRWVQSALDEWQRSGGRSRAT